MGVGRIGKGNFGEMGFGLGLDYTPWGAFVSFNGWLLTNLLVNILSPPFA